MTNTEDEEELIAIPRDSIPLNDDTSRTTELPQEIGEDTLNLNSLLSKEHNLETNPTSEAVSTVVDKATEDNTNVIQDNTLSLDDRASSEIPPVNEKKSESSMFETVLVDNIQHQVDLSSIQPYKNAISHGGLLPALICCFCYYYEILH